ncbi:DUF2459 domain-containing protein [Algibacter sp. 2305UL17-15]|uniref:DUF2459 domain-containing protein n=1 Tax=Algibacter sp. 2305UL17-15 TaxID=3231268 RepID=UPI00345AFE2F
MKTIKKILKWILYLLALPVLYTIISFLLTAITINKPDTESEHHSKIYLSTNGVHLNIVIQKKDIDTALLKSLLILENEKYISFGWGDENFYINTPTWGDLTFKNAFSAMFLKSSALIHLTRYSSIESSWVEVPIDESELKDLNNYILDSFVLDENGSKIILPNVAYTLNDNFYKAKGSYSCFNTCNSWVNRGFKTSGLKACLWTPFDFGLIGKYE